MSSARGYGSGRSSAAFTALNRATAAAIPRASVPEAARANAGCRRRLRAAPRIGESIGRHDTTRALACGLFCGGLVVEVRPGLAAVLACAMALACGACGDRHAADRAGSEPARRRTETLARTRVWSAPRVPPARADFSVNPPGPGTVDAGADVDCTFVVQPIE